jgi:DNA-binding response OmpR family regulator
MVAAAGRSATLRLMRPNSSPGPGAKKILVVEDDPIGGLVLFDYLEAHGYKPFLAKTGPNGVAAFAKSQPDLVLLDVALPKQNGFEVCFAIRRLPRGEETPVLFMSAVYTDVAHAERYVRDDLKAQGYFVKPFALDDLLARVRELLGDA